MTPADLAEDMARRTGRAVTVTPTRNRRRLVSVQRTGDTIRVRLHEALLDAPDAVREALARFVANGCRASGRLIRGHLKGAVPDPEPRPPRLRTAGRHHHLGPLFDQVAERFEGPHPAVTWGARRQPGAKRVRLGTYDPALSLIRVNPLLDHPTVPAAVVRFVLHHELAHHALGHGAGRGQRLHGATFSALERQAPEFEAASRWMRDHLPARLTAARAEI